MQKKLFQLFVCTVIVLRIPGKQKPRANALGFVFYRAICEELLLQNNLAAQTGVCSDVLTAHLSVLERISLSRILLCLYHDPAGVASLVKQIEYSVELYAAVRIARYGECACANCIQEGPCLLYTSPSPRDS